MNQCPRPLSYYQWLALEHLYRHRHLPFMEARFVGRHITVRSLLMRTPPLVVIAESEKGERSREDALKLAITREGIAYYDANLLGYQMRYPALYRRYGVSQAQRRSKRSG
jgi:hypothetical protein